MLTVVAETCDASNRTLVATSQPTRSEFSLQRSAEGVLLEDE